MGKKILKRVFAETYGHSRFKVSWTVALMRVRGVVPAARNKVSTHETCPTFIFSLARCAPRAKA